MQNSNASTFISEKDSAKDQMPYEFTGTNRERKDPPGLIADLAM
jgi:hypothetical protein